MNKTTLRLDESLNRLKHLMNFRLNESDITNDLNEVDWDKTFSDVKKSCIPPEKVVEMLNARLATLKLPSNKREKTDANTPIIGAGNIPLTDGEIDIQAFIDDITAKPNKIFDRNPKMEKTDKGQLQYTVNTGIPALRGILYDKENNKFFIINTCPGAGACAVVCYARRGFYLINDGKNLKYIQRLNLLMNDPEEYENIIMDELEVEAFRIKRESRKLNKDIKLVIRWNDAGDFFAKKYFDIAISATNQLLSAGYNVVSYAYTKVGDIANITDPNFIMNFSDDANKKETEKIDKPITKLSKIVPRDLYRDIFMKQGNQYVKDSNGKPMFKDENSAQRLKLALSKEFNLPIESLVFTDELPNEIGKPLQYNVIVKPTGDSDIGAQRTDVWYNLLLAH